MPGARSFSTALLVAVAACAQSSRPVATAPMERVLAATAAHIAETGPRVRCEPAKPLELSCAEVFDDDHFTLIAVTATRHPAGAPVIPEVEADQPSLGPGGGGGRYRRTTADGRWLMTATEFQRLTRGMEPKMPQAVQVVDRIVGDYDRQRGTR